MCMTLDKNHSFNLRSIEVHHEKMDFEKTAIKILPYKPQSSTA